MEIRKRLQTEGLKITNLNNGLGLAVETEIPSVVTKEDDQLNLGKKDILEKTTRPGFVFFIDEKRLQTPFDVLSLTDEIAKLHPETAKNLRLHLLAKASIGHKNALN